MTSDCVNEADSSRHH